MPVQPAAWHASWPPLGRKHQDLPSVSINGTSEEGLTFGLEELVDFGTSETSNQLLSEGVLVVSI